MARTSCPSPHLDVQARAGSNEAAAARRPIRELRATRRVCAREAAIYLIMSCGTCPPLAVVHRSGAGRASPDVWRGLANAPRVSNQEATPVPCDQCPGVERAPHTCAARQYYVAATALAPVSLLLSSSKNWTEIRFGRPVPVSRIFRRRRWAAVVGRRLRDT